MGVVLMTETHEALTTQEAANLSGYAPSTIRQAIASGRLKGEKRGRDWFVDRESLMAYKRRMDALGTAKHTPYQYREDDDPPQAA